MSSMLRSLLLAGTASVALITGTAFAHEALTPVATSTTADASTIEAPAGGAVKPEWDIVRTVIATEGNVAVFRMEVSGKAGAAKPTATGKYAGTEIYAYVWPTSIDPAEVGFEAKSGILAFAVATHPDFDDTPIFDENGDGKLDNDGNTWHTHWVVLVPDETMPGMLKVRDLPEGVKPRLPKTWPGVPIFIDSPGYSPAIGTRTVEVRVPFDNIGAVKGASFDGVTAGLRVNANLHKPLWRVPNVFDVASGKLTLPGKIR
ncbi:hypothetical protein [Gloeobacter violaceus]|nr:hypothetical protein [Gloeobacter violaceus]